MPDKQSNPGEVRTHPEGHKEQCIARRRIKYARVTALVYMIMFSVDWLMLCGATTLFLAPILIPLNFVGDNWIYGLFLTFISIASTIVAGALLDSESKVYQTLRKALLAQTTLFAILALVYPFTDLSLYARYVSRSHASSPIDFLGIVEHLGEHWNPPKSEDGGFVSTRFFSRMPNNSHDPHPPPDFSQNNLPAGLIIDGNGYLQFSATNNSLGGLYRVGSRTNYQFTIDSIVYPASISVTGWTILGTLLPDPQNRESWIPGPGGGGVGIRYTVPSDAGNLSTEAKAAIFLNQKPQPLIRLSLTNQLPKLGFAHLLIKPAIEVHLAQLAEGMYTLASKEVISSAPLDVVVFDSKTAALVEQVNSRAFQWNRNKDRADVWLFLIYSWIAYTAVRYLVLNRKDPGVLNKLCIDLFNGG